MSKIVLVTGGNSGIGLACVKHFVNQKMQVITTGRRELKALKNLSDEDKVILDQVDYQQMDVANEKDIIALFTHIQKQYGHLDIAVNNAGVAGVTDKALHDVNLDEYDYVMDINQKAVWRCIQEEVKLMLPQQKGAIVNISSVAGLKASKVSALYGMSKFAVNGLTKCAAVTYADQGIRVNAVCPAPVDTPLMQSDETLSHFLKNAGSFIPMGRSGTSDEVANLVVWLSCDEASWMTGAIVPIDGGASA